MEILRKLMTSSLVTDASKPVPSISIGSVAFTTHKGIFSLLSCKNPHDTWIVDTSAFDHMTSSNTGFSNYKPCKENVGIIVANGSMGTTTGRGDMKLNGLKLNYVIHVPNLQYNLLLVSKLTNLTKD